MTQNFSKFHWLHIMKRWSHQVKFQEQKAYKKSKWHFNEILINKHNLTYPTFLCNGEFKIHVSFKILEIFCRKFIRMYVNFPWCSKLGVFININFVLRKKNLSIDFISINPRAGKKLLRSNQLKSRTAWILIDLTPLIFFHGHLFVSRKNWFLSRAI